MTYSKGTRPNIMKQNLKCLIHRLYDSSSKCIFREIHDCIVANMPRPLFPLKEVAHAILKQPRLT